MSDTFHLMIAEYKTLEDLQVFAQSQFRTIIDLTKKLKKAEEENSHLQELLAQTNPLSVIGESSKSIVPAVDLGTSDSEIIARTQLAMLKSMSMTSELTLEETKKTQIFTDILLSLEKKPDGMETRVEPIDTAALLAALDDKNE